MSTFALSGQDSLTINTRVLNDFATGNVVELTFPNEIATLKTGKNGNSVFGFNATGKQAELKVSVIRGSADDKYLNGQLEAQDGNFVYTALATAEFIKKIGDGKGNVIGDTYVLGGGIFTKRIEAKSNVEGEAEQSVAIYTMKFSVGHRVIG
jgi:hypothetical protein